MDLYMYICLAMLACFILHISSLSLDLCIVPLGIKQEKLTTQGDFSFARSLATQYRCRKLCATCYDSQEALYEKYPQAEQNIQEIQQASRPKHNTQDQNRETEPTKQKDQEEKEESNPGHRARPSPKVLFSVDARKLGTPAGGGKDVRTGFPRRERKRPAWQMAQQQQQRSSASDPSSADTKKRPQGGPWDVICFNFPHVGGLSTDVNRQVRANQELLVAFFKACVPLVSVAPDRPADDEDDAEWEDEGTDSDEFTDDDDDAEPEGNADGEEHVLTSGKARRTGPGQILVTLFEAEPYTLWNVKDLARHAGLKVVTSFRFPWSSYQGYSHARTLGEVEGKNGGRGGWRGEDREARMYVFEVKREEATQVGKKKKRARDDSSDSE